MFDGDAVKELQMSVSPMFTTINELNHTFNEIQVATPQMSITRKTADEQTTFVLIANSRTQSLQSSRNNLCRGKILFGLDFNPLKQATNLFF